VSRTFSVALALLLVSGACVYSPDVPEDPEPEPVAAMTGFSFVVEGELAGMPRPGTRQALAEDMAFLSSQGIELLVSLTEVGTDPVEAYRHRITVLHLPVRDFTAPTLAQLEDFARAAHAALDQGKAVGVHCGAGLGRTGTFLAAYFVTEGMTGDAAIAHVRALRPGSIETASQEQAVREFAAGLVPQTTGEPPGEL
jgi:atypical dual specificity phosphatase